MLWLPNLSTHYLHSILNALLAYLQSSKLLKREKNFRILSLSVYVLGHIFSCISKNLQKVQNDKVVNDIIYLFGNFSFSLYFMYVLVINIKINNIKNIIFMLLLLTYNILLLLRFSIKVCPAFRPPLIPKTTTEPEPLGRIFFATK